MCHILVLISYHIYDVCVCVCRVLILKAPGFGPVRRRRRIYYGAIQLARLGVDYLSYILSYVYAQRRHVVVYSGLRDLVLTAAGASAAGGGGVAGRD